MGETNAPYVIDRQNFISMLGDCFEIVMRTVAGQHIAGLDEDGNAVWGEGTEEECLSDAEYAINKVSWHAMELVAHGRAVEDIIGADYISGDRFQDYMVKFDNYREKFVGDWEAVKTATEFDLGLDTEREEEE